MCTTNRTLLEAVLLYAVVSAAAAIATATTAAAGEADAARVPTAASTPAPMVGVATGETVNGVPVYRLPPITVTAGRKVELAKIAQEDATARAKRKHANAAVITTAARQARETLAASPAQN